MATLFIKLEEFSSEEIHKLQIMATKYSNSDMNKLVSIIMRHYLEDIDVK